MTNAALRTALAGWLVLASAGCSGRSPGEPVPPPPEGPGAATGPRMPITLALDSVTVDAAVHELSRAAGRSLVVDPTAERYAHCAHVSLSMPAPRPAEEVAALLAGALASSGFTLATRPEGLVLSHDGATRPAGCSPTGVDLGAAGLPDPLFGHPMGPGGPPPIPEDLASSIRAVSDTEWEVLRSYRDGTTGEGDAALMRSARIVPNMVDGEITGLRLFGIRRSSLLSALGFQNGDTVLDVNGRALAEPDQALEAYAALRGADRYEVHLERRGEARTHVIRIVDALGTE